MTNLSGLIPELGEWNDGKGIAPANWIWIKGRADHALGYCAMLWPEIVAFEDYVLTAPVDVDRLREWERAGTAREQIEIAMNVFFLDGAFQTDSTGVALKDAQTRRLAEIMVDMLSAKLLRDFPGMAFSVFVIDDEDDFGVSFYRA